MFFQGAYSRLLLSAPVRADIDLGHVEAEPGAGANADHSVERHPFPREFGDLRIVRSVSSGLNAQR